MFKQLIPKSIPSILFITATIILALEIFIPKVCSSQIDEEYIRNIDTEKIYRYFVNEEYMDIQDAEIDTRSGINNSTVTEIDTNSYSVYIINPHQQNDYIYVCFLKKMNESDVEIQFNILLDNQYSNHIDIKKTAYMSTPEYVFSTSIEILKNNVRIRIRENTTVKRSNYAQAFLEEIMNDMLNT